MKRTKIIATLGPATDSPKMITDLITSGVNIFRLNFSHGDHQEHLSRIKMVKEIREQLNAPVALLADLQGPKIRVGQVDRELKKGETITFTCSEPRGEEIPVQYKNLVHDVEPGDRLLLDDGKIEVKVLEKKNLTFTARVVIPGRLTAKKGINLPTGTIKAEVVTEKDTKDALFALANGVDFLALSFVKDENDIKKLQKIVARSNNKNAHIVAKIERHEALDNLEGIINQADGVMVARGDLGIELPAQEVPIAQKKIIRRCLAHGKPAIVATQMLESMISSPRSTRAETSDIANAILDGADATMLSGETSVGAYPLNAVRAMNQIALNTEAWIVEEGIIIAKRIERNLAEVPESVAKAGIVLAHETDSRYIIAATSSGKNARQVAKFRPHAPIIGVAHDSATARRLALSWGVLPIAMTYQNNTDMIGKVVDLLKKDKKIKKGDKITVISGLSKGKTGGTNIIRIHTV